MYVMKEKLQIKYLQIYKLFEKYSSNKNVKNKRCRKIESSNIYCNFILKIDLQITYKLETKFNQTCGPRPKWTIYNAELIYEQPRKSSSSVSSVWQNPIHNSLQVPSSSNMRLGMNCLKSFGIEFDELKLLRVEGRPTSIPFGNNLGYSRLQLLLANPVSHVYSRCCYKPTSLQPITMVRADMVRLSLFRKSSL